MSRKIAWITVAIALLGLLVQLVSFAEPIEMEDQVSQIIALWNPNITQDDLVGMFGDAYSETETYIMFWREGQRFSHYWNFDDGRLTSVVINSSPVSIEYRSWTYDLYLSTKEKITEILGESFSYLSFYEGSGRTWEDLNCVARAWSVGGIGVQLAYNQAGEDLSITVEIASIE